MSTFFMFWIYAAPAARMAALQRLRIIGIATHDSIGIGEDGEYIADRNSYYNTDVLGPTHQPIALATFYRALPNINFIRPADAEECMGMWLLALDDKSADTPSLFALSRQPVPLLEGSDRHAVAKGAYPVMGGNIDPNLTIIATGAEVARALAVAQLLSKEYKVRVVSMPSQRHFDMQSMEYRESVLHSSTSLVVAIEAWSSYGWAKYAHASLSMHTFVSHS
jgi:dihydroxyacetone synthase